MDADRRSTVSSFYGGRKGSLDALNNDFPNPPRVGAGRDDASSFFNPDRTSRNLNNLDSGRPGGATAGYNRGSYFFAGREEPVKGGRDEEAQAALPPRGADDDTWDVYADFNNAGPRYSTAFGQGNNGYQALDGTKVEDGSPATPVELVTVPALGPEWKREELRAMTKAGKREVKAESRKQRWKEFNRGERGLCGKWFSRKTLIFFIFGLCAAVGLVLVFVIPRVPSFSFNGDLPLANATGDWGSAVPTIFSRFPANFSFPAYADLQLNTADNFIPLTFNHLRAKVYDLDTSALVGQGDLGKRTVPAKAFPDIMLPLNFTYSAPNDSDVTWGNWYRACRNVGNYANGTRPGVKFRLVLEMDIAGLVGSRSAATQVSNANCPIELGMNSV